MIETTQGTQILQGPIGIFDSGFGGLTILREILERLPGYEYVFLGDNARAPYGTRSFDMVYRFTLQAVNALFDMGCPLVILACNTASAKALRTIQQHDLPASGDSSRRVLGVIRPTAEAVSRMSRSGHIGIFATPGTIASGSYEIEVAHQNASLITVGQACPLWVPLIETGRSDTQGADYFIEQDVKSLFDKDPLIDTVILGCTHYPIISESIKKYLPAGVNMVSQGSIVADSLADYLHRHPEMNSRLLRTADGKPRVTYYTTENPTNFDTLASVFVGHPVAAEQIQLPG